jgi:hypothetical protein
MNIETMRLLVAKGLSAADLLEVAEAMAVRADPTAAERQARRRAKVKAEAEASHRDVTRDCDRDSVTALPLSLPPNENISNPPTHTPEKHTPARRGLDFPMLDCTDAATWRDFLRNRKTKGLPNTESAHRKLVRDLAAMVERTGWPPGRVFQACVEQGWGAIYETDEMKGAGNGRSNQNIRTGGSSGPDKRSGLAKALDRGIGI